MRERGVRRTWACRPTSRPRNRPTVRASRVGGTQSSEASRRRWCTGRCRCWSEKGRCVAKVGGVWQRGRRGSSGSLGTEVTPSRLLRASAGVAGGGWRGGGRDRCEVQGGVKGAPCACVGGRGIRLARGGPVLATVGCVLLRSLHFEAVRGERTATPSRPHIPRCRPRTPRPALEPGYGDLPLREHTRPPASDPPAAAFRTERTVGFRVLSAAAGSRASQAPARPQPRILERARARHRGGAQVRSPRLLWRRRGAARPPRRARPARNAGGADRCRQPAGGG